ncbi:hypothetical protein ABZP36_011755 [Zizania latifolia]
MAMMVRSKFVVPMLLLSVLLLLGSSLPAPAAAARPLADGGGEEAAAAGAGGVVLVMPSSLSWRLRHWLPAALEMKQGASCSTWDSNNACPPPPRH